MLVTSSVVSQKSLFNFRASLFEILISNSRNNYEYCNYLLIAVLYSYT